MGEFNARRRRPARPGPSGYNQHMEVTVLLFASVADALKARRLTVSVGEGETIGAVRDRLARCYPALARFLPTLLYARNEEYATEDTPLTAGDTLALIPPVSGG